MTNYICLATTVVLSILLPLTATLAAENNSPENAQRIQDNLAPIQKDLFRLQANRNAIADNNAPRRDPGDGPDEAGYMWMDDEEEGGPVFEWVDVSRNENVVNINFDDDHNLAFELGFEFSYYRNNFREVRMCSNGWASFTSARRDWDYSRWERLPFGEAPENLLSVAMSNWDPREGGRCYYWTDDRTAVMTWEDVRHVNGGNWTFQIILNVDGTILYQYRETGEPDGRQLVAFQDSRRELGFEISRDQEGYLTAERAILIQLNDNNRPEWVEVPDVVQVEEEGVVEFRVVGRDADDDELTINMWRDGLPEQADFEDRRDGSGVFSWRTAVEDVGYYNPRFILSDGDLLTVVTVQIVVGSPNRSPEWVEYPQEIQAVLGDRIEFTVIGRDPDEDALRIGFDRERLPEAAEFVDNRDGTGDFYWRPGIGDDGQYNPRFALSDGDINVVIEIPFTIGIPNRRPVWDDIPDTVRADVTDVIEFQFRGSDPDQDELRIVLLRDPVDEQASTLPDAAEFADAGGGRGSLAWRTNEADAGLYKPRFVITDENLFSVATVVIIVRGDNHPPYWERIPREVTINEGVMFSLTVVGNDTDRNDRLSIRYNPGTLPIGARFFDRGDGSGLFTWQPDFNDAGDYWGEFILTDGLVNDTARIDFRVNNVNRPPEWREYPEYIAVAGGARIAFDVAGLDPDDDNLRILFRRFNIPEAATFRDNRDGTGSFYWETDERDRDRFSAGFILDDGTTTDSILVVIDVGDVNRAPEWAEVPEGFQITEGEGVEFQIVGRDPDNDEVSLAVIPGWIEIPEYVNEDFRPRFDDRGDGSGVFSWRTVRGMAGDFEVRFVIADRTDSDTTMVPITVLSSNQPPRWVRFPESIRAMEESLIAFDIMAEDPERDRLWMTIAEGDLPNEARLYAREDNSALFTWRPTDRDAGEYNVRFIVFDGEAADTAMVRFQIDNNNRPPEWGDIPEQVVINEGELLELNLEGRDPDDDQLSITFVRPEEMSVEAQFTDNRDGTGTLVWRPRYNEANDYLVRFVLSDGDYNVTTQLRIIVRDVERPPRWVDIPDSLQAMEGDVIEFSVTGEDPDLGRLGIYLRGDELPMEARMYEDGEGHGRFIWRTDEGDAGVYNLIFILTDGERADSADVRLRVLRRNNPPVWRQFPEGNTVIGYAGDPIQFDLFAEDPDDDRINYSWEYAAEPPAEPEFNLGMIEDVVRFTLRPTADQYGVYYFRFYASDGMDSTALEIRLIARRGHYRYQITGRRHTIRFEEIYFYADEERHDPDPSDEIAVVTPGGMVAGSIIFDDNMEIRAQPALIVWGDNPETEEIEGFRDNEEFTFLYWDYDQEQEYPVPGEYITGAERWRQNALSVFNISVGPKLLSDEPEHDFGFVGVNGEATWEVTFRSQGTVPVTDLRLSLGNEAFTVDDAGPADIAVANSWSTIVRFSPANAGDQFDTLHAVADYGQEISIPLSGRAIEQGHFEYTVTGVRHRLYVAGFDMNGEGWQAADEIGVFTPDDLCAGGTIIRDNQQEFARFGAWADDPETGPVDGFRDGEAFAFRVWDSVAEEEVSVSADFVSGPDVWREGSTSTVSLYQSDNHFHWLESLLIHDIQIDEIDMFGNRPSEGDEVAVVARIDLVAGGSLIEGDAPWSLVAYGANPNFQHAETGFNPGERIYFRLWSAREEREYMARVNWTDGPSRWEEDGRSTVELSAVRNDTPPVFRPIESQVLNEDEELRFQVAAYDRDRDPLSLRLIGIDLPPDAAFDDNGDGTGIFSWTPGPQGAGEYTARFIVYDGWIMATLMVRIRVNDTNQPPVLQAIGNLEVDEGDLLDVRLEARDEEDRELTFTVENLPFGAILEDNLFRWTPTFRQAGVYENVIFRVSDFGQPPRYDEESVTITVNSLNQGPEWSRREAIRVTEGSRIFQDLFARDPDRDTLEFQAVDLPEGAAFEVGEEGHAAFMWETGFGSAGVYEPYFIVSDGNLSDTLELPITVTRIGRRPYFDRIGNRTVGVDDTLDFAVNAHDPDEGDQEELVLTVSNLPEGAEFEDQGGGEGLVYWIPTAEDRGIHPDITFIVTDPGEARGEERVTFAVRVIDNYAPLIASLSPAANSVVDTTRPTFSAVITDQERRIRRIGFYLDNREIEDFNFDEETGEFSWTPEEDMDEGYHRYLIRAEDADGHNAVAGAAFQINTSAGVIIVRQLPEFTTVEAIHIQGSAEPSLSMQLYKDEDLVDEVQAGERGRFRFDTVHLTDGANSFVIYGSDEDDIQADSVLVEVYRDLTPPTVEMISPDELITSTSTDIVITVSDSDGVGVNWERLILTLDSEPVVVYAQADDTLSFTPDSLSDGEHIISVTAVDDLGNAPEEPPLFTIFVDSRIPEVDHAFFSGDVDTIANDQPRLNIAVYDPRPSSGIASGDIILTLDDEPLEFDWNNVQSSILYNFGVGDPLDAGDHTLSLSVSDSAGNQLDAEGSFFIGDIEDDEPPFFGNLWPPSDEVAGFDMADTVSFVMGDNDAGVNWESLIIMIIARGDPDDPDDDDTTYIGWGDFNVNENSGRVFVNVQQLGDNEGPFRDAMGGLDEGMNEINAFGEDNEGNGGDEEWEFFMDVTDPDPPVFDDPADLYVNTSEVTLTGVAGEDGPNYPEDYDNDAYLLILINGEIADVADVELELEFEVEDVALVEGENEITGIIIDAGENESAESDPITLFLDLTDPSISDFYIVDGPNIDSALPQFIAVIGDDESGVDPDALELLVGDTVIPIIYDAETDTLTAEPDEALADGDYLGLLTVVDMAGNWLQEEYEFTVETVPPEPPEFTLQTYTSINLVDIEGTGTVGTEAVVLLDGEEIGSVDLADSAAFEFEHTALSLSDTSEVRMFALSAAGTSSDTTDAQLLIVDDVPPDFSSLSPEDASTVDADTLTEVIVFVSDEITGIDTTQFDILIDSVAVVFQSLETDSGFWLSADVSEIEFDDEQQVQVIAQAADTSNPPNSRSYEWEFITEWNDPPVVALPDSSTSEDTPLTLNLTMYLSDPDDDWEDLDLAAEIIDGADNAAIELVDGILQVTPNDDWVGSVLVEVTATDPGAESGADTTTVTFEPVNDAPYFDELADTNATIDELFEITIAAIEVDEDDTLTYGDNSDLFDIDQDGLISFTPDVNDFGFHPINLFVYDLNDEGDTVEFNLYITARNQEIELIGSFANAAVDEDDASLEIADLDTIFYDPDETSLTYSVAYDPDGVALTIDPTTQIASIEPDADFFGQVTITVTADDLMGSELSTDFDVTVEPVNDPPRQVGILPDQIFEDEDPGEIVIVALDTVFIDVEDEDLTFDFLDGDSLGVSIDENLVLSVRPNQNWFGTQSFILSVDDGVNMMFARSGPRALEDDDDQNVDVEFRRFDRTPRRDEATDMEITVTISPLNDPPMASQPLDDLNVDEDSGPWGIGFLSDIFSDVDDDSLAIEYSVEDSLTSELVDGILSIDAPANYFADDLTIIITATDSSGAEAHDTLLVTIDPVNDSPEIDSAIPDEEHAEDSGPWDIVDLDEVFSDVDLDDLSFTIEPDDPLDWQLDENNLLTIEAPANWNGDDFSISVTADDGEIARDNPSRLLRSTGEALSTTRTSRRLRFTSDLLGFQPDRDASVEDIFLFTVTALNDAPTWVDPAAELASDEGDSIEVLFTADDVDLQYEGDNLTLTMSDSGGTVDLGAQIAIEGNDLTYSWVPDYDAAGQYQLTFTVEDDSGEFADADFTITINNINRAPVLEEIGNREVVEDEELVIQLAADDADGDNLEFTVENLPEGAEFDADEFRWTPSFEQTGNYQVTFTVTDDGEPPMNDQEVINITVGDANRPPVLDAIGAQDVDEDSTLVIQLSAADPDEDEIVFSAENMPQGAEFADNEFSWTPDFDQAGEYDVTFIVADDQDPALTDEEIVTITVNDINRAPVLAQIGDQQIDEDSELSFQLSAEDPDVDNLTYSSIDLPDSAVIDGDQFTWTPGFDQAGQHEVTFRVTDDGTPQLFDEEIITITVADVNRVPVWNQPDPEQEIVTDEGDELTFNIQASDPDGDDVTIEMTDSGGLPEAAGITDNGNGTAVFVWETTHEDSGVYNPLFTVSDGVLSVDTELTIRVADVNRAPVWDDVPAEVEVDEAEAIEFTVSGSDADGDDLTVSYRSDDLPDAVEFTDNGDGTGTLAWTPGYDDAGEYTAVFSLSDGALNVDVNVSIIINNVNRAPVLADIGNRQIDENDELAFALAADDPDGQHLTFSARNLPAGSALDGADFSWIPDFAQAGNYDVTFRVADNGTPEMYDEEIVTITVNNVNRPPVWIEPDPEALINADEGDEITFEIQASDPDQEDLTIEMTDAGSLPEAAELIDNGDGTASFSWHTTHDDAGDYSPVFTVSDGDLSIETQLSIRVTDQNRSPVWVDPPDVVEVEEDEPIDLTIVSSDPDGDDLVLGFTSENLPEQAEFTDNGDGTGTLDWTPTYDEAGEYSAIFTSDDGAIEIDVEVIITVVDVNRAPILAAIGNQVTGENEELIIELAAEDPDGDGITFAAEGLPDGATFENAVFTWTPGFNETGNYEVLFRATDDGEPPLSDEETITISVGDVNRPPVLAEIGEQEVAENEELLIQLAAEDPDDDAYVFAVEDLPEGAEFDAGEFRWTPDFAQAGEYSVLFTVTDDVDQPLTDEERVTIVVTNVNRAPVLAQVGNRNIEENEELIIHLSADDPDGDGLTFTAENLPDGAELAGTDFSWTPGFDQEGDYQVTFIVTDDGTPALYDEEVITISVGAVNQPPVLAEIGNREVDEGSELIIRLSAEDPDEDELRYSAQNLPEGSTLEGDLFSWTPSYVQAGEHEVTFIVTDNGAPEQSDEEMITIFVVDINRAPIWEEPDPEAVIMADEGDEIAFDIVGSDPDNDNLTIGISDRGNLPEEADLIDNDDGTASFSWQTGFDDAGDYGFAVTISDGNMEVTNELLIRIAEANQPPVVENPIGDVELDEDSGIFEIADLDDVFSDPDDDELAFGIVDAIEMLNAAIDEQTNVLTIEPADNYFGGSDIVVSADDGRGNVFLNVRFEPGNLGNNRNDQISVRRSLRRLNAVQTPSPHRDDAVNDEFTVTVLPVNDLPVIVDENDEPMAESVDVEVGEDEELIILLRALDIEDDANDLNWQVADQVDLPDGWEFTDNGDGSAQFSWTPSFEDSREEPYSPLFSVTDTDEGTDEITVNITVTDINRPPVWEEVPELVEGNEDEIVAFDVRGADADGDDLTIEASSEDLPEGWEFTDNGDGSGEFAWTPTFDDAGEYTLDLTLSDGELEVPASIEIVITNTNRPPEVVNPIADLHVDEDTGPWEVANLNDVFSEPDGDVLAFRSEADDPLVLVIDEDGLLTVSVPDNYNTVDGAQVAVTATDSLGAETNDTFLVFIAPVNDLPTIFSLVSPEDNSETASYPMVTFEWEPSTDEIDSDTISYALMLTWGDEDHWFRDVEQTSIDISRDELSVDSSQATELTWKVFAYDSQDSVESAETFSLRIAPLNIYDDDAQLPVELTLGPLYPNPFNSSISIDFSLPAHGEVSIIIYDLSGRMVYEVLQRELTAGYHQAQWSGVNQSNERVSSGTYICRLVTGDEVRIERLSLIR